MKSLCFAVFLLLTFVFGLGAEVFAQYSSSNYKANEVLFGAGGNNNLSSPNYKANSSVGALGVGRVSSAGYQAYSGFLTPDEPFLELGIDTSVVHLGTLDPATTKTGTANFHVRAYINSGYSVKTISLPPAMTSGGSHTLSAMTSQASSSTGIEQFGINLKANTSPTTFGSNPSPQPDGTFATGVAATGYDTADQYKYSVGDIIAETPAGSSGWGATNFTMSYIANIGLLTPAGDYSMIHDLVVVATF